MNADTMKIIEEQLQFKNRRLQLKEKEHSLTAKKWRERGTALVVATLLVICGIAVFFGGKGLCSLSDEIMISNDNRNVPQPHGYNNKNGQKETIHTLPSNRLAVISPSPDNAVIVKAESEIVSDQWPLVVAMIMYGLLVVTGLTVAAFTVKNIANHNNE